MKYFRSFIVAVGLVLGLLLPAGCNRKPAQTKNYSAEPMVFLSLGSKNREFGLRQVEWTDGKSEPARVGASDCRTIKLNGKHGRFLYFVVDPSFKAGGLGKVKVDVEYFDATPGEFSLEYDGQSKPYTPAAKTVKLERTLKWQTAEFELRQPRFENSQNASADFRLVLRVPEFFVRHVVMIRDTNAVPETEAGAANEISITFGATEQQNGITRVEHEDGKSTLATVDGKECRQLGANRQNFLYFQVAPAFKVGSRMKLKAQVEYYDANPGTFTVQYDGWSGHAKGRYAAVKKPVKLTGSHTWKVAEFKLPDARFENRQNAQADFRIDAFSSDFCVHRVVLVRE